MEVTKEVSPRVVMYNHLLRYQGVVVADDLFGSMGFLIQPPDTENRMSGGVGGVTNAISLPRPDRDREILSEEVPASHLLVLGLKPKNQSPCLLTWLPSGATGNFRPYWRRYF
jgi:hypothetical protein